jgi:serine protease Do
MKKNYKKFATFISISLLIFFKFSLVKAIEKPDFSELAEELIPSVVSVSVMISANDVVSQPRSPQAPQFPPGSPFEDFFKDFFERRGVPPRGMPPPRQKKKPVCYGIRFYYRQKRFNSNQ